MSDAALHRAAQLELALAAARVAYNACRAERDEAVALLRGAVSDSPTFEEAAGFDEWWDRKESFLRRIEGTTP